MKKQHNEGDWRKSQILFRISKVEDGIAAQINTGLWNKKKRERHCLAKESAENNPVICLSYCEKTPFPWSHGKQNPPRERRPNGYEPSTSNRPRNIKNTYPKNQDTRHFMPFWDTLYACWEWNQVRVCRRVPPRRITRFDGCLRGCKGGEKKRRQK